MRERILLLALLLTPTAAYAQEVVPVIAEGILTGQFFVAVIAGLILAYAFQLALGNLSVAAGISAARSATSPNRGSQRERSDGSPEQTNRSTVDRVGNTAQKMGSAFGMWTLITASIALFFASWIALELTLVFDATVAALTALVIWGVFITTTIALEATMMSSIVGSLIHAASSGLRSAYRSTTSLFSESEEEKAREKAEVITREVRDELFADINAGRIERDIQNYINQLKPQHDMPKRIREELAALLDETEIRAISEHEGAIVDRETLTADLETKQHASHQQAQSMAKNVQHAVSTIKEEAAADGSRAEEAADASLRMTGMSKEEAQKTRQQWEDYLRSTGKEELNPEGIKHDLEELFHDPSKGAAALMRRVSHMDKSTITELLARRKDMSREQARKTADRVEQAVNQIRSRMRRPGGDGHSASRSAQSAKESARNKIRNYLNSLNQSQLHYDQIEKDIQRLFHDPKAEAKILKQRLQAISRENIEAIVGSQGSISSDQAKKITDRIEAARDKMMAKAEEMQEEVQHRMQEAKEQTRRSVEEARKMAATTAWWAFATIIVSGGAAVIGGLVAVV